MGPSAHARRVPSDGPWAPSTLRTHATTQPGIPGSPCKTVWPLRARERRAVQTHRQHRRRAPPQAAVLLQLHMITPWIMLMLHASTNVVGKP